MKTIFAFLVLSVCSAVAGTLYQIQTLPTLPNSWQTLPQSINNSGMIVGRVDPVSGATHAVSWNNSIITDLGSFGNGANTSAYLTDVNDSGVAVGYVDSPVSKSVIWQNAQATLLSQFNNTFIGINNTGLVVGNFNNRAATWNAGVVTTLVGLSQDSNLAYGINNTGQIVGVSVDQNGDGHAVLWNNQSLTVLGSGVGYAINDNGLIVGGNGSSHAFSWQNGTMTDLTPGAYNSVAFGVNSSGLIIGNITLNEFSNAKSVLWKNGQMLDLLSLIPANSGWNDLWVQGINDSGQLVGGGTMNGDPQGYTRGFLMSPTVPEPSALLPFGLLALALRRRR